jgi:hypothetical protein
LNIDFGINNNKRQDYNIGTVWGGYWWEGDGIVNGKDEGEGIWLMGFMYIYKIQ